MKKRYKEYFKPIYKIYQNNPKNYIKRFNNVRKYTKWLIKCTFLCANTDSIIHGCKEISCNNEFVDKKNHKYYHGVSNLLFEDYGVFVHTDCWKFIKKEYNIELKYLILLIMVILKNIGSNFLILSLL